MKKMPLIILLPIFMATLSIQTFASSNSIYTGCTLNDTAMTCATQLTFTLTAKTGSLTCSGGEASETGTVSCSSNSSPLLTCNSGIESITPPSPLQSETTPSTYYKMYCSEPHIGRWCYSNNSQGPYTCL